MKRQWKQFCAFLLAVLLLAGALPAPAEAASGASGTCGEGLHWSNEAGRLTISGSGEMSRYQDHTGNPDYFPPWYSFRQQVKSLKIEEGITVIGDNAFNRMGALEEVVLPESLVSIRAGAFIDCGGLRSLELPEGLTSIGQSAFARCGGLQSVSLPDGLSELGENAFGMCTGLTEIAIPAGLPIVSNGAFSGCSSLEVLRLPSTFYGAGMDAFTGCSLKHIYFDGTRGQWEQTSWDPRNDISGAEVHCLREPEPTPTPGPSQEPTPTPGSSPTAAPTPDDPATSTPTPKPKPTLRPEPSPYEPYARFVGEWNYKEEGTDNGAHYTWYAALVIDSIENNCVSFGLNGGRYISYNNRYESHGAAIGAEPGSRIVTGPIKNGKASFTYRDDGHGNTGRGTITFRADGIVCSVTQETGVQGDDSLAAIPHGKLMKKEGFVPGPIDLSPRPEGRTPFTDVFTGAWYVDAVRYVYTEALFNGTSATTFDPNSPMTRAQIAQVLANRTDGYSKEAYGTATCFTDVAVGSWMCAPVRWAYRNDLTDGMGANTFSPNTPLTREQLATFLYRYAVHTGADTSTAGNLYAAFPDTGSVSSWAKTAMQWAVNRGIINGSGGKLNPKGTATRAQVAQMFYNAKDVLTSTQLLPREERPDPDLTPKLKDKVDTGFVLKCIGDFAGRSSTTDTGALDTEAWFELCAGWARDAYASNYKGYPGMISPISKDDILSAGSTQVTFSRHCMDKPLELFGGRPETVLAAVSEFKARPVERLAVSGGSIVWTMPSSGFTRFQNMKLLSFEAAGGKAVLKYSFDKQADPGWEVFPRWTGTAVLVPAENSLGYKIESLTVSQA